MFKIKLNKIKKTSKLLINYSDQALGFSVLS